MVWALSTGSSLSTIPGMLKQSHGIQKDGPRWLGGCTLYHHQRESSSFYDFFWLYLKVDQDLEWPSVCYIQGSMYGKRITRGWSWVDNLLGGSNCNAAWNSISSVVSSYLANWWSDWASSSLGSIQDWTMWWCQAQTISYEPLPSWLEDTKGWCLWLWSLGSQ